MSKGNEVSVFQHGHVTFVVAQDLLGDPIEVHACYVSAYRYCYGCEDELDPATSVLVLAYWKGGAGARMYHSWCAQGKHPEIDLETLPR